MNDRMCIVESEVPKVIEWFKTRGGVVRWSNLEIGNNLRPDQITPAKTEYDGVLQDTRNPHWAMGQPKVLQPEDIDVSIREPIELPPEWFPECEHCKASGKRHLQEIADARKCSLEDVRKDMNGETPWGFVENDQFPCNFCRGKGHVVKQVTGRIKRNYWGVSATDAGAKRMANRLATHLGLVCPEIASSDQRTVRFNWQYAGYGLVEYEFYTERIKLFTDYMPQEATC